VKVLSACLQQHIEEKTHPSESFDCMLARTQFRGKHTQSERFDCMLARTLRGKKTPK
jgi:hypothetical protein